MKVSPDPYNKGQFRIDYRDSDGFVTEYCRHMDLAAAMERIKLVELVDEPRTFAEKLWDPRWLD